MAHYTRLQMMPHTGKKTPRLDKMLFFGKKEKPAELIDLEKRRQIIEALKARNQKTG